MERQEPALHLLSTALDSGGVALCLRVSLGLTRSDASHGPTKSRRRALQKTKADGLKMETVSNTSGTGRK